MMLPAREGNGFLTFEKNILWHPAEGFESWEDTAHVNPIQRRRHWAGTHVSIVVSYRKQEMSTYWTLSTPELISVTVTRTPAFRGFNPNPTAYIYTLTFVFQHAIFCPIAHEQRQLAITGSVFSAPLPKGDYSSVFMIWGRPAFHEGGGEGGWGWGVILTLHPLAGKGYV